MSIDDILKEPEFMPYFIYGGGEEKFMTIHQLRALAERVIREQREIDAMLLNKSRSELQLMCGEMTDQEFRTVSAILMNRMVAIRSQPTNELSSSGSIEYI